MITCERNKERIASCNTCHVRNYHDMGETFESLPDVELFDVAFHHNEQQRSVMKLCPACLRDLANAIHPHRKGI